MVQAMTCLSYWFCRSQLLFAGSQLSTAPTAGYSQGDLHKYQMDHTSFPRKQQSRNFSKFVWLACRRPVIQVLGPPLVSLGSSLGQSGRQVLLLGRSCASAGGLAVKAIMGPPMAACIAAIKTIAHFMLPLWQVSLHCCLPLGCFWPNVMFLLLSWEVNSHAACEACT